jgi:hypothetical protein
MALPPVFGWPPLMAENAPPLLPTPPEPGDSSDSS